MSSERVWPVYGGRSFNLWQPDTGDYYAWAEPERITSALHERRLRGQKNRRSAFSEFSREWAEDRTTLPCLRPRIAFRDVTRPTDTRTAIAALVPGDRVLTNQAPYILWPSGTEADQAYVLGVLSSMILDWFARRVLELHLNFHIFNSLPIPRPELDPGPGQHRKLRLRDRVIQISGRLATTDPDRPGFREWAAAVGVEPGSVESEAEKQDLIAELDAVVAFLYDLDEDDLAVIYDTFHAGADYSERRVQVLQHFRSWRQRVERRKADSV